MTRVQRRLLRAARRHGPLVDRLALPRAWTVADLTASVERECGQTIVWMPLPEGAPPELCGLEFSRRDKRVVFHRPATGVLHRRVIAHAAAHLLLGHPGAVDGGPEVAATLIGGVSGVHAFGENSDRAEAEAEELAELLLDLRARSDRTGPNPRCSPHHS